MVSSVFICVSFFFSFFFLSFLSGDGDVNERERERRKRDLMGSVLVSFFLGVFVWFLGGFGAVESESEKEDAWMWCFGLLWGVTFFHFFLFSFLSSLSWISLIW